MVAPPNRFKKKKIARIFIILILEFFIILIFEYYIILELLEHHQNFYVVEEGCFFKPQISLNRMASVTKVHRTPGKNLHKNITIGSI